MLLKDVYILILNNKKKIIEPNDENSHDTLDVLVKDKFGLYDTKNDRICRTKSKRKNN